MSGTLEPSAHVERAVEGFFLNTGMHADSAITDMRGEQDDKGQIIVAVAVRASPTYFLKTNFSEIKTAPSSPIIVADGSAPVKIQECTFSNSNTATNELRAFGAGTFFVDANDELTVADGDGTVAAPQPLSASRGNNFLTDADEWSVNIREVRPAPLLRLRCACDAPALRIRRRCQHRRRCCSGKLYVLIQYETDSFALHEAAQYLGQRGSAPARGFCRES